MDTTLKRIHINRDKLRIEITFPFSVGLRNKIKELPDRSFDWDDRVWHVPVTNMHATYVSRFGKDHGFFIDKEVLDLTRTNIKKNKSAREKLYDFQRDGLDFLHSSGGRALLCDDMGLGKTIQTLSWIDETRFSKILIVCPASVSYMWQDRFKEWLDIDAEVIIGYTRPFNESSRVLICSYNVFTERVYELAKLGIQLVVADEVHNLSNSKTKRFKAMKTLNPQHFLGLSGTPFLNRPRELWALLNIVNPVTWNNFFKFGMRYCAGHKDWRGYWDFDGASNLDELKKRISTYLLRRTKQEVLTELPDITRNYLPYLTEDRVLIRDYNTAISIAKEQPTNMNNTKRFMSVRRLVGMMKITPAVELAEDVLAGEDKVVLFAIHRDVVAALENKLSKYGVIKIVGDTPQQERNDLINSFLTTNKERVAIISAAGAEGINLYSASTLIFVEREWNPGKEGQIESRIHRIGQKNPCTIYYIIARNTIDERIHNIINKKRDVLGQLITFDDIPVNDLLFVNGDRDDS